MMTSTRFALITAADLVIRMFDDIDVDEEFKHVFDSRFRKVGSSQ